MINSQYIKFGSLTGLICTLMLTVTAAISQTPVLAQITPAAEKFGSDDNEGGSTDSSSSDDDNESSDSGTDDSDEESEDDEEQEIDTDSDETNHLAEAIKNRVKGALSAAGIDTAGF